MKIYYSLQKWVVQWISTFQSIEETVSTRVENKNFLAPLVRETDLWILNLRMVTFGTASEVTWAFFAYTETKYKLDENRFLLTYTIVRESDASIKKMEASTSQLLDYNIFVVIGEFGESSMH